MGDRANLALLTELFQRFDEVSSSWDVKYKHLAIAVGVSESQVSKWRSDVKNKNSITLNYTTEWEILSVLGYEDDRRIDGMEWTLDEMRSTLESYELAAELRRRMPKAKGRKGDAGVERSTTRVGISKTSRIDDTPAEGSARG